MNRLFPTNSHVCFLGDSITANGLWIAHSLDYYAARLPDDHVKFYNCGISGGSVVSGLKYLEESVYPLAPTHAVIMYGMNDVQRSLYGQLESPEIIQQREQAMINYRENLTRLADILSSRGISLIFCSTTPYDEGKACETENLLGCAAALKRISSITEQLAGQYNSDFIDFNTPMSRTNAELQEINQNLSLISDDRVHPMDAGYDTISALFLRYLGFSEIETPAAVDISKGYTMKSLSDRGYERYVTDTMLRDIWATEWLLLESLWGMPDDVKIDYIQDYLAQTDDIPPYFRKITESYLIHKLNQEQWVETLYAQMNAIYSV